ncbi:hypothetical protein OG612_13525 [Streptomyces sp. NBC_01527]
MISVVAVRRTSPSERAACTSQLPLLRLLRPEPSDAPDGPDAHSG